MLCFGRKKRKQSGLLNNEATAVTDYPDTTNAVDRNKGRPASASQVCPVVQENDQSNRQHDPHEQCKNRQKASDHKVDELRAKMERLKKERKEKKEEMTKLKDEHLRTIENQNKEHQRTVNKLQEKVSRQKIDIQELKDANNELLTRLSAMAGARLTDGNANIADLSDENRPTKLAERYSELYDNEWTDAFEVLTAGEYVSEQDACHTLLEALCALYNACKKKANGDLENMREAIKKFLGGKEPPSELMKPLKEQRKKIHGGHIKHLKSDLKDNIHKLFPDKKKRHDERLKMFLNKGIELCWLMVIQDPSVYLDVASCNRYGEKYESTTLKPYTQSGQCIDYIVWPPLYLNEGGNILCKGIAQCKSGVTNRISCNERPPTSEQEITRATKTETELEESVKETKNSETKPEDATLSVSDSYHNDRYTEPGTCSNQKESNHAKPISLGILSDIENENRSELPVLDEMLTTNEVNKHDAETNITTVTETDGQEKMGAIDNSEFPSEVNLTVSKANFSKNYINVEQSYCQETTITLKKGEERDHRTEIDHKSNLPADISMDRPGANFDTKSNDYNESNPNIIPSNAKLSVNRKRKSSNATRSKEDDRNTKASNPNTTTAAVSSKGQTTMETSYPGFENYSESPPTVKNTDDKSKQYSLTYPETGRKKKNKDNRKLNIFVGKAT